jgi:acyl-CoA thioesterase
VSLRFEQDGKVVALALGALAVWRGGSREHQVLVPPRVKPPGAVEPVPDDLPGLPAFTRNYRYRWAVEAAGAGSEPRVGGWIATREPRPVDHVSLAAFADAFPPAVFTLLDGRTAAAPTIDLTIHFRAPILPAGWVLAAFETGQLAGGRFEEDGELWSEDGVLLAQSRQLAFLREPAP